MAASNLPWDLDVAVLRRLEKRVLVPLPVADARQVMIAKHLRDRAHADIDYAMIAKNTEGYSGADIELICRESAMMPVRRLIEKVNLLDVEYETFLAAQQGVRDPGMKKSGIGGMKSVATVDADALIKSDPVTMEDISNALATTRPSSDGNMKMYEKWQSEFGSV